MKKSISAFLLLAFFTATHGQDTTVTIPEVTKTNYLKKSKNQKTAAWILAGVGSLSLLLGAIEVNPEHGGNNNRAFFIAGGLVAIGASVPLFIASARNKKKGTSVSFKNNVVPQLRNNNFSYSSVPSISLKFRL